ncbi:hypothetical protein GCM10020000_30660 [Streptomyces olivoverticillatus]
MLPFAPLGVLLPWAGGRIAVSPLGSLTRTVFTCAMLSLALQVVQSGVAGQVLDVDGLLLNLSGVTLAHLAVVPAIRARLRRRSDGGPYPAPPPGGGPQGADPDDPEGRDRTVG